MEFFEIMIFTFPLWKLLLLTLGGLFAGFINTIAGGGSLLTIPLLIFLGLPSPVANGTNRIAIFMQNVMGVARFSRKRALKWDKENIMRILAMLVPSLIGAVIGAIIATQLSKEVFDIVVGILMILVLLTLFLKPKEWEKESEHIREEWWRYPVFLLIGMYGGFIQAGVGFLLLTGLVVGMGFNLVTANALKVLIVLIYTILALLIFILNGQVILIAGLFLGVGNVIGAVIGVSSILKIKPVFLKWIITVAVTVTVAKLFGLFELLGI
jgi:uncharacterized protein